MPSPIGHAMAGVATAWLVERLPPRSFSPGDANGSPSRLAALRRQAWLPAACGVLATLPDLDLLFGAHRSATHSVGAAVIVTLVALLCAKWLELPGTLENPKLDATSQVLGLASDLAGRGSPRHTRTRTALTCGLAYASHVALDWLGKDTANPAGLMALWPITQTYFVSGLDLFQEVSRRYWRPEEFVVGNLRSLSWELAVLGPITLLAWWLRPGRICDVGERRSWHILRRRLGRRKS